MERLPTRPIISNLDTATYWLAKHLGKLLSLLRTLEYTVKNTKDFIVKIRNSYSIFWYINIIHKRTFGICYWLVLKQIYEKHVISMSITRNKMRETLLLCTKNANFTFRNIDFLQTDTVAMSS